MTRITRRQITFHHSFRLAGIEAPIPAGTYVVETEEERLEGLSFEAWRRLGTVIRLPRRPESPLVDQVVPVDPGLLEASLVLDAGHRTEGSEGG